MLSIPHEIAGAMPGAAPFGNPLRQTGRVHLDQRALAAFTLVELLVTMTVLMVMILMLATISNQITGIWRQASGRSETFREARDGFESMTRRLSQATLNTYYDYYDKNNKLRSDPTYVDYGTTPPSSTSATFVPSSYQRTSELRFISGAASSLILQTNNGTSAGPAAGQQTAPQWATHAVFFQAPLGYTETNAHVAAPETDCVGLSNLLNTWGYYTEYTSDSNLKPAFVTKLRNRFRLMELSEPTESLTLYKLTSGNATLTSSGNTTPPSSDSASNMGLYWFRSPLIGPADAGSTTPVAHTRVLAENVVALILLPQLSVQDTAARKAAGTNTNVLAPNYSYDSTSNSNYPGTDVPLGTGGLPLGGAIDASINPKHQLPPVVQVTMIAVDEPSAIRIEQMAAGQPIAKVLGLDTRFKVAVDDQQKLVYPQDLSEVESGLAQKRLSYRVFTSQVSIRAARWSTEQKQ